MPKEQMELKLAPEEKRMLKKLTRSLDTLARSMQLYMPQKPKNSEIRLTEPAVAPENYDWEQGREITDATGSYLAGQMSAEEYAEAIQRHGSRYGGN